MKNTDPSTTDYSVLTVVVYGSRGSRVLRHAKRQGIAGGTVFRARGMSDKALLRWFELHERRLEAVVMLAEERAMEKAISILDRKFRFSKPHHGFAFRIPVVAIAGMRACQNYTRQSSQEEWKMEYSAIYTIVDKGKAEGVVETSRLAGATGATIIDARGSGIHEAQRLFAMEVEPEKEIVLILTRTPQVAGIVDAIREHLCIDEPGNGMLFVQPVQEIVGLGGEVSR